MKILAIILNLPWTLIGLLAALISIPKRVSINKEPFAIVFHGANFWWYKWFQKLIRGMNFANVIILGKDVLPGDLEHELVHVRQFEQYPFVFAFMYESEALRKGYKNNKYEEEVRKQVPNAYSLPSWSFGHDELADKLKNLVLSGKKTATTGFLKESTKVPNVGDYATILDRYDKPFCTIQYTKVEVKPFLSVDWDFAKLEGEDENLEQWREGHRNYFKKYYPNFTDGAQVVCSEFKLVFVLR